MGQNFPWPPAHSAVSAAARACGCTSSRGKFRNARRARPSKRSSSNFSADCACLQFGHSKSPYSTTVTGACALPVR